MPPQDKPDIFRIKDYPYFETFRKNIAASTATNYYLQSPIYDFYHWTDPGNVPPADIDVKDMPAIQCDLSITSIPGIPRDEVPEAYLGFWGSAFKPTTLGNEAACTYSMGTTYTGVLNLLSIMRITDDFVPSLYADISTSGLVIPTFRVPIRFLMVAVALYAFDLTSATKVSMQLCFRTL